MKAAGLGFGLLALVACESVTSERIAKWKTTQKGPARIEEALRSSGLAPRLRALAAAAMVDLGMPDKVDEVMATLPAAERWEILKTLVPIHVAVMRGPGVPKARDARDALCGLRQYAPPEEQKQIDAALLASLEVDLGAGRFTGGRHSLEKMLVAVGAASGPMLVKLIAAPDAPYKGLAELLAKVADEETRDRGGAALVRRAAAEKAIPNDLWIAMGWVGGRTVSDFLVSKVRQGSAAEAALAAKAMQQSRFPAVLPLALQVAGDPMANRLLRDEMFGVVEKIGGPQAQKGLLGIISGDKDSLVRYRAYEAALAVGKADAVLPALQAFPPQASFRRDDVIDFLAKDIAKIGFPARAAVLSALSSPSVLARMTAVLALEAPLPGGRGGLGTIQDVPALLKLKEDRGTLKGFPAGTTVGSEVRRVAAHLQRPGG